MVHFIPSARQHSANRRHGHAKHHPDFAQCLQKLKYETYRFRIFRAIASNDLDELCRLLKNEGQGLDKTIVLNRTCTYMSHSWMRRNETVSKMFELFQPFLLNLRDFHYHIAYLWGELHLSLGAGINQGPPPEHILRLRQRRNMLQGGAIAPPPGRGGGFAGHAGQFGFRRIQAAPGMGMFHMGKMNCQPKMMALPIAVSLNSYQACLLLLEHGAKVSVYEVVLAIRSAKYEIFLLLISFWDAVSKSSSVKTSSTILPILSKTDLKFSQKVIHLLTQKKFLDRHVIDYAIQWHRKDIMDFIFSVTNVNLFCKKYYRAMESVFSRSTEAIVKTILQRHGGIQIVTKALPGSVEKNTPLHYAALHFREDILSFLLKELSLRAKDVNILNGRGQHPLHLCCYRLARDLGLARRWVYGIASGILSAKVLVRAGAQLNRVDAYGYYPLQILLSRPFYGGVLSSYHEELIKYMVDCGVNLSFKGSFDGGETALHYCARIGTSSEELARLFLRKGLLLSMENSVRQTPLHADVCKDEDMRELLKRESEMVTCRVPSLRRLTLVHLQERGGLPAFYRHRYF